MEVGHDATGGTAPTDRGPLAPLAAAEPLRLPDRPAGAVGQPGLGPDSTIDAIQDDAPFDLMAGGTLTQDDQLAFDELSQVERRLLLDFFHYRFEGPARD